MSIASAAVVVYAVTAGGYKSHEAELNDGGVWVVNGKLGWSGRLNKPINQLDGMVPTQSGKTRIDVVQDGAAVVTLDRSASRGQAIETSRLESQDGGSAAIPTFGEVRMAGGTLASADAETGEVWAVRYDDQHGLPVMGSVDRVLRVVDGASATVPPRSVLQQAGPAYDAVLVGAPDALLSVDLDSGDVTTVASGSGAPVEPVRLGACVFGAWSGGAG